MNIENLKIDLKDLILRIPNSLTKLGHEIECKNHYFIDHKGIYFKRKRGEKIYKEIFYAQKLKDNTLQFPVSKEIFNTYTSEIQAKCIKAVQIHLSDENGASCGPTLLDYDELMKYNLGKTI